MRPTAHVQSHVTHVSRCRNVANN